jgi:N,N'-diacetyllegionaminate synthase
MTLKSKKDNPILIFECANAHGGDLDVLLKTITSFSSVKYNKKHIKFQPFHPDTISLDDFSWHNIYHQLKFKDTEWGEILELAHRNYNGVWLDLFDLFGIEILKDNFSKITGLKLQASVLENYELLYQLKGLDLSGIMLMINVSGFELTEISMFMKQFSKLNTKQSILQIGHQAYPTKIKDTGLQKIPVLKSEFKETELCVADHVDAEHEMATIIPLLALSSGATIIEKHICIDRNKAEYDFYSSLELFEMNKLTERLSEYSEITTGTFISKSEAEYLNNSIQIPVAKAPLTKGAMISKSDLFFRRTAQKGMTYQDIKNKQKIGNILKNDIKVNTPITEEDFQQANIGVIVACRMKSSRLKQKALIEIDGETSVERCLNNCLNMSRVSTVVLATSTVKEDAVLQDYTLNGKVKFYQGDADDVIQRYLGASKKYNIDTFIRVTADCPVISTEIAEVLLDHHFSTGADYTAAKDCAVGTGCEIYNVEALQRVIKYLGSADYSEYMTWYMKNNEDIFKVEIVDLPSELVRNYRLTLDYSQDLELFKAIYQELSINNNEATLENVFAILDNNPEIVALNSSLTLRYKTDQELIDHLNQVTRISLVK